MAGAVGVMKRTELFYALLFRLRVGDCGRTIRRDFFVLNLIFSSFLLSVGVASAKMPHRSEQKTMVTTTNERIDTSAGNE